jgi:hypothetical protein
MCWGQEYVELDPPRLFALCCEQLGLMPRVCFHQEVEPFLAQCHACGRRLVTVMSELRSTEGQTQVTRRQLHHQHRALTRALIDPDLQRLRREGKDTLTRLEERAQWLPSSEDVRSVRSQVAILPIVVLHTELDSFESQLG